MGCSSQSDIPNLAIINETPLLKSKSAGYFKSIGQNPFWSLEIAEDEIRFKEIESGKEWVSAHVEPIRAEDSNIKLYRLNTLTGEMLVNIKSKNCSSGLSDLMVDYQVDIEIKDSNLEDGKRYYSGCGNYVIDYRLFDVWYLEELDGKKVSSVDFAKEIPSIVINSAEKIFSGYGGCNRISGTIFQERELLRFTNVLATQMACEESNKENKFIQSLQSSTAYKIKNNRLYLIHSDKIKMIFKKMD